MLSDSREPDHHKFGDRGVCGMPELAAAIVGATALVLVVLAGLTVMKWGMTFSEMTEASRQRLVGCGLVLFALGILGCVVAFGLMVAHLLVHRF
jgi:hypothetical protein